MDVGKQRETWFRNMFKWAPWSVYPIHWKGFVLLFMGPAILAGSVNAFLIWRVVPVEIALMVLTVGFIAFMIAVYRHTSWD